MSKFLKRIISQHSDNENAQVDTVNPSEIMLPTEGRLSDCLNAKTLSQDEDHTNTWSKKAKLRISVGTVRAWGDKIARKVQQKKSKSASAEDKQGMEYSSEDMNENEDYKQIDTAVTPIVSKFATMLEPVPEVSQQTVTDACLADTADSEQAILPFYMSNSSLGGTPTCGMTPLQQQQQQPPQLFMTQSTEPFAAFAKESTMRRAISANSATSFPTLNYADYATVPLPKSMPVTPMSPSAQRSLMAMSQDLQQSMALNGNSSVGMARSQLALTMARSDIFCSQPEAPHQELMVNTEKLPMANATAATLQTPTMMTADSAVFRSPMRAALAPDQFDPPSGTVSDAMPSSMFYTQSSANMAESKNNDIEPQQSNMTSPLMEFTYASPFTNTNKRGTLPAKYSNFIHRLKMSKLPGALKRLRLGTSSRDEEERAAAAALTDMFNQNVRLSALPINTPIYDQYAQYTRQGEIITELPITPDLSPGAYDLRVTCNQTFFGRW